MLTINRDYLATILLLLAGCEFTPPGSPLELPVVRISGRVTIGGAPVSAGWVTSMPIEGTVGNLDIGRIGPDGSYAVTRAPVGRLQVRVEVPPRGFPEAVLRSPILIRAARRHIGPDSPLRATTVAGMDLRHDIDLLTADNPQ